MIDMKVVRQKADYAITTGSCTVEKEIAFEVLKELEKDTSTFVWDMKDNDLVTFEKVVYH